MHVYRWDLDKTYLETDFDSFRGLVRSATEPASAKMAVPGAGALLRALSQGPGNRIFILSGSPEQMRRTLEEKLRLDGVRYEQFILKDQLGHLRKGEFRAIRGQFGYKLPELLKARRGLGGSVGETCFGDDAEVDALVYSVYGDALAGRLDATGLSRIMEAAGSYPESIDLALRALRGVGQGEAVQRVFIRAESGLTEGRFGALGGRVVSVHSWFQAALVLCHDARVAPEVVAEVTADVMERREHDEWQVAALAQDLVRRGHVSPDFILSLTWEASLRAALEEALLPLFSGYRQQPFLPHEGIDYVGLIKGWHKRPRPKVR